MPTPKGQEVYTIPAAAPVVAGGVVLSDAELGEALKGPVASILRDDEGNAQLEVLLAGLVTTEFEQERLRAALDATPDPEDWRVGEALAEAYLSEHRQCEFPWHGGRDLKNPKASAAGTDLVGFQHEPNQGPRFAFGEVKTSYEEKYPPQVVTSRHGLSEQVELLRDSCETKNHLLTYLAHKARTTDWEDTFKGAARRYFTDPTDVCLFGVLVRDVVPSELDLRARAKALAKNCPSATVIELRAVYLPSKCIPSLASRAKAAMAAGK